MNSRIQLILKTKNISASKFADEIGVQRSSISHILSGRNNPSLDFIQKILKRFPDINSDWILTGKGSMYLEPDLFNIIEEHKTDKGTQTALINDSQEDIFTEESPQISDIAETPVQKEEKPKQHIPVQKVRENVQKEVHPTLPETDDKKVIERIRKPGSRNIERIVIFYSDKTCNEYYPE